MRLIYHASIVLHSFCCCKDQIQMHTILWLRIDSDSTGPLIEAARHDADMPAAEESAPADDCAAASEQVIDCSLLSRLQL